jgi:hypothetical protein
MNYRSDVHRFALAACVILMIVSTPPPVHAQPQDPAQDPAQDDQATEEQDQDRDQDRQEDEGEEPETVSEEIVVTGSRIPSTPLTQRAPIVELDELALERTGTTNLGTALQQLPSMGSAINTKLEGLRPDHSKREPWIPYLSVSSCWISLSLPTVSYRMKASLSIEGSCEILQTSECLPARTR